MKRSSLNIAGMLLTLAVGITVGALGFRDLPNTNAATERSIAPTDAPPPVAPVPTPDNARHSDDGGRLGVIFARQSADIVARSDGALQAVYANLGDRVKAGDVIAEIDSYSITQQLGMAEAALRSAQADQRDVELELQDAQTRYHRREQLAEEGLVSMEDLATAKVQCDRAEAKLHGVQAHVAEQTAHVDDVKRSVANTVITAPFDGTVAARYLDAGAVVRFGASIVSLIRPEDLWVRFAVGEQQRPRIGTIVEFELQGSTASIPATIEYLAPSITATSQELLVEARLQVPAALLDQVRPGAIGRVSSRTR
jgi:RND family efflux transporter MFP subunit